MNDFKPDHTSITELRRSVHPLEDKGPGTDKIHDMASSNHRVQLLSCFNFAMENRVQKNMGAAFVRSLK